MSHRIVSVREADGCRMRVSRKAPAEGSWGKAWRDSVACSVRRRARHRDRAGHRLSRPQFRERALEVSERELTNSALLLSRHFDQQLADLQHVHDDVVAHMQAGRVDTAEAFERQMSTLSAHEMLRTKLAALPHVGGLNLFNVKGQLINSSEMWPVADVSIADRRYFREFTSGGPTPDVIVEPAVSKVTKIWTTIFARKIIGRHGEIIGFATRGVEPSHFLNFVASLALSGDTTISMVHRDGTVIARYPHDDNLIGKNVGKSSSFQQGAGDGRQCFRDASSTSAEGEERIGSIRPLTNFPILIVASTNVSSALADWRAQSKLQFSAAFLAVLVVIATIYPDRSPVEGSARGRAAAAVREEPASRLRHQQHDPGTAAVRRLGPPRHLQPALHRYVRLYRPMSPSPAAICAT